MDGRAQANDSRLVARDDQVAFQRTYEQHIGAVRGLTRRLAGPMQSEDLAHEVFVRLWVRPDRFDASRGSMRTYLLTIAHSISIDRLRSDDARHAREGRHLRLAVAHLEEPDDQIHSAEVAREVELALRSLPETEREAILLTFYGRRTYREAALELGLAEGTVKTRIRTGLRRLHEVLRPDESEDSEELRGSTD